MAILRRIPGLPRLRLSSIDSIEADPRLMEAIGGEPRLMPHLHLSLQAGDDLILKRMKRRHLRDDAIAFCAAVRAARPEVVFGADIIAGFPTETEAMFGRSLDLVRDCGLTWLHVFPYSARQGTPAARMPQVDGGAIRDRAARLRALGEACVSTHLARMQGRRVELLMERSDLGRTEGFTRDPDPRPPRSRRDRVGPDQRPAGEYPAGRSGLRPAGPFTCRTERPGLRHLSRCPRC